MCVSERSAGPLLVDDQSTSITFDAMILLLAGFALSLLGSLPPGLISLSVAQTAVQRGLVAALVLGAGAAVAEFFQAWLAAEAAGWFLQHPAVEQGLRWAAVPVFLGLGGWLVWKPSASQAVSIPPPAPPPTVGETRQTETNTGASKNIEHASEHVVSPLPDLSGEGPGVGLHKKEPKSGSLFAQGLFLSLFNLLAIPYWLAYCAGLRTAAWWRDGWVSTGLFSAGVMVGTFAALALYAWAAHRAVQRSEAVARYANRVVGLIFLGLGLWALLRG